MAEYYLGEIRLFAFNEQHIPSSFLPCDGRQLDIQSYQALYAILGVTYGGNGTTSFNIPDMRGRVPVSVNNSTANAPTYQIGQTAGQSAVTLTNANIPVHTHTVNVSSTAANTKTPSAAVVQGTAADGGKIYCDASQAGSTIAYNLTSVSVSNNSVPAPDPHTNLQPTISLTYAICTNGLFPYHS